MCMAPAAVFLFFQQACAYVAHVKEVMWFVLAWGLPKCGRKNSVICLLILPLFTNAPSKNNYSHVVELHLEFQKLLWRLHDGASLDLK